MNSVSSDARRGLSRSLRLFGQTIVNSDPGLDFGEAALQLDLRSCLCLPIFDFGTIVGVLGVYHARIDAFSRNDVRRLGSLAQDIRLAAPGRDCGEWPGIGREANSVAVA